MTFVGRQLRPGLNRERRRARRRSTWSGGRTVALFAEGRRVHFSWGSCRHEGEFDGQDFGMNVQSVGEGKVANQKMMAKTTTFAGDGRAWKIVNVSCLIK